MKRFLLLLSIMAFVIFSSCTGSKDSLSREEVIIGDGLVGYWPFEGDADDATGNGHDGEIFGPVLTEDRNGNPESAYYFDGIDDHIDIEHSEQLKPPFPISIVAWVRIDSTSGGLFDTNFSENWYLGVFITIKAKTRELMVSYGSDGPIWNKSRRTASTEIPELGKWFHLAAVYNDFYNISLYINGQNIGGVYSGSGASVQYDDSPMSIGRVDTRRMEDANSFKGALDQLRIYNRELSKEEILMLYQSGN